MTALVEKDIQVVITTIQQTVGTCGHMVSKRSLLRKKHKCSGCTEFNTTMWILDSFFP
jgi:hypothetical protein